MSSNHTPRSRWAASAAAAVAVSGLVTAGVLSSGAASTAAPARGATVPFLSHEAESAATNAAVLPMDRTAGTLSGEASGRRAVRLGAAGQFVEFTLTAPANALTVRYSIPDTDQGTGRDGTLSVYVNGAHNRDLNLTSRYGHFYGSYPYTNNPAAGKPHHFYDETRALLGTTYPAGTKIRFQADSGDITPTTVDVADFEQVAPPSARPADAVSVTDHGATANDGTDDGAAFVAAVAAGRAQNRPVWIPAGTFTVNRHITVDRVTLRGAGHWHSVLRGNRVGVYGLGEPSSCGQGGNSGVSTAVTLRDFAIIGEVTERVDCDQVNGIGGALGGGSLVQGLYIQHTKVGLWLDGPFSGLTVRDNRIVDQTADGLNLHRGVTDTVVTNNFLRNIGDDGLAMWSESVENRNNTFSFNTVIVPILANNIAIYGGRDISVTDNHVADTQTQGGGIHIANRFAATPVAGTFTVARNTTLRAGVLDPNWQFGVGALWFDGRDSAMTATINVTDTDLIDNSYEGIHFIGSGVRNVNFDGVRISGAGTFAVQLQTSGAATFRNVVATGIGRAGIYSCMGQGAFTIGDLGGNSGWLGGSPYCGPWPTPVYGAPPTTTTTTTPPPTTTTTPPPPGNLALNRPVSATGHADVYVPRNAVDGNPNTYWESVNRAFPQSLTVDLGTALQVRRVVLKLPPSSAWGARNQTLTVLGSADGGSWSTLAAARDHRFDPATGNTVTIAVAGSARHLRVTFTANTAWPAGQASELEVYS
ncbi:discoidin domain-containing protein [Actinokineospora sp. 24-640]